MGDYRKLQIRANWDLTPGGNGCIIVYTMYRGEGMGTETKLLTIRTPKALHEAAKEKAEAEDVTISQVIRWWLRAWLDGDLPTRPPGLEQEAEP